MNKENETKRLTYNRPLRYSTPRTKKILSMLENKGEVEIKNLNDIFSCPQALMFALRRGHENGMWQIVCSDGKLYNKPKKFATWNKIKKIALAK